MRQVKWILAAATFACGVTFGSPANALAVTPPRNLLAIFDEAGNTLGSNFYFSSSPYATPDPGPGGQTSTLAYLLPPGFANMVSGDVYIYDTIPPPYPAPPDWSDQLRFIGGDHPMILVYSDEDPPQYLADKPLSLWPTETMYPFNDPFNGATTLLEEYSVGFQGVIYTPDAHQPGYLDGVNITYKFFSGAIPEPATWAMMLLGFGAVGGALRSARRRQKLTVSYV